MTTTKFPPLMDPPATAIVDRRDSPHLPPSSPQARPREHAPIEREKDHEEKMERESRNQQHEAQAQNAEASMPSGTDASEQFLQSNLLGRGRTDQSSASGGGGGESSAASVAGLMSLSSLAHSIVREHYQSLGYRVHSGLQYGTEFVLYAANPTKVHSDFCVHVVPPGASPAGWTDGRGLPSCGDRLPFFPRPSHS
jgi:hypothetical protein